MILNDLLFTVYQRVVGYLKQKHIFDGKNNSFFKI